MTMIQSNATVAHEIADGDCVGTSQLARENHLQPSTIFRWIAKGLPAAEGGRVRLEAIRRGRRWLTSRAAVRRFFAALPANPAAGDSQTCKPENTRPHSARQHAADDAKAALKNRFGI